MDWTAWLRPLEGFLLEDEGGESVEYAVASVVVAVAATATQRAMTEQVSAFAAASLDPTSAPK